MYCPYWRSAYPLINTQNSIGTLRHRWNVVKTLKTVHNQGRTLGGMGEPPPPQETKCTQFYGTCIDNVLTFFVITFHKRPGFRNSLPVRNLNFQLGNQLIGIFRCLQLGYFASSPLPPIIDRISYSSYKPESRRCTDEHFAAFQIYTNEQKCALK